MNRSKHMTQTEKTLVFNLNARCIDGRFPFQTLDHRAIKAGYFLASVDGDVRVYAKAGRKNGRVLVAECGKFARVQAAVKEE